MARYMDPVEEALWKSSHYKPFLLVTVFDNVGTLYDVTGWLESLTVTERVDSPVSTANMIFARGNSERVAPLLERESLSPLASRSPFNIAAGNPSSPSFGRLFSPNHTINIWVGYGAPGDLNANRLIPFFTGRLGNIEFSSQKMKVSAQDEGRSLLRSFIQVPDIEYGSVAGQPIEDVLANLIFVNAPQLFPGQPILSDGPGALLSRFKQIREPILLAQRKLALQIGWDFRFRWINDQFRLHLRDPSRLDLGSIDYTIEPSDVLAIKKFDIDDKNVRNVVRVVFFNSATGQVDFVEVRDQVSIDEYDELFMEMSEEDSNGINTTAEALTFANAALSDLKDAPSVASIETMFSHRYQLGDYLQLNTDDTQTGQDIRHIFYPAFRLGVVAVTHTITPKKWRSRLDLRGTARIGAAEEWLRRKPKPDGMFTVLNQSPVAKPSHNATSVIGTWIPDYRDGPEQRIFLLGDTHIEFPRFIERSQTFHIHIEPNGFDITFGAGYYIPKGTIPSPLGDLAHANFIRNHDGLLSGVVLAPLVDPNAAPIVP